MYSLVKKMDKRIIAILAVVIVVAAGAAAAFVLTNNNNKTEEKKGLYLLDAAVLDVDMGAMSGTPKVIDTIEYMYSSVYGDLTDTAKSKKLGLSIKIAGRMTQ